MRQEKLYDVKHIFIVDVGPTQKRSAKYFPKMLKSKGMITRRLSVANGRCEQGSVRLHDNPIKLLILSGAECVIV